MRKAGDAGLLMIDAPAEYGGLELDKVTSVLAAEKMAAGQAFSVSYGAHTGIGTLPLVYYGTPAQKEKYLGKIITGEWSAAYCLTEPGAGSDAMGGTTTATLSADGKHYLLDGTKQFITNGGFATLFTVFAKIDRKHFTAFLVERDFPGVTVGPEEKKLGIKGSSTTSVILEDAKVPVENLLGEIGKGHKIAFNVLNVGRFKLGAAVLGAAKHALGDGRGLRQPAQAVRRAHLQLRRHPARSWPTASADLFASESLVYRLAGLIDDRLATIPKDAPNYYEAYQAAIEEYSIECAISKVFCSEVLADVVDDVVQIHGGYGFIQEYPAEKLLPRRAHQPDLRGDQRDQPAAHPRHHPAPGHEGGDPARARRPARPSSRCSAPRSTRSTPSVPFAAEKATLANLKKVFLVVSGAAVQALRRRSSRTSRRCCWRPPTWPSRPSPSRAPCCGPSSIGPRLSEAAPGAGGRRRQGAHLPRRREGGHRGQAGAPSTWPRGTSWPCCSAACAASPSTTPPGCWPPSGSSPRPRSTRSVTRYREAVTPSATPVRVPAGSPPGSAPSPALPAPRLPLLLLARQVAGAGSAAGRWRAPPA